MNKIPDHAQKVFTGEIFDVYQWEQEIFDGTKKIFERLKRNHTVDVIAVSPEGKICVLEERQPGRGDFSGLVGGTGEDHESPIDTAKRELLEETGFVSDEWEVFGVYTRSSRIDSESYIFIARNCLKQQDQSLDVGGECIQVHMFEWDDFLQIIAEPRFRVQEFALEIFRQIFLGNEQELKERIFGS